MTNQPSHTAGSPRRGCGHTAAEHAAYLRDALVRYDLDREIDDAARAVDRVLSGDGTLDAFAEITAAFAAAPSGAGR